MCDCNKGIVWQVINVTTPGQNSVAAHNISIQNFSGSAITEAIFASAATTGTLVFWGHCTMTGGATAGVFPVGSIVPIVNGVDIVQSTGAGNLQTRDTLMITGSVAINQGEAFSIRLSQSVYTAPGSIDSGVILWYIQ